MKNIILVIFVILTGCNVDKNCLDKVDNTFVEQGMKLIFETKEGKQVMKSYLVCPFIKDFSLLAYSDKEINLLLDSINYKFDDKNEALSIDSDYCKNKAYDDLSKLSNGIESSVIFTVAFLDNDAIQINLISNYDKILKGEIKADSDFNPNQIFEYIIIKGIDNSPKILLQSSRFYD